MKRGLVILLAMSLLLAACGGGSTEDNGDDGGDQPTATQPADDGVSLDRQFPHLTCIGIDGKTALV